MIFFGKIDEATLLILQRALGFPGAVNFTIRSQFGSALSFFKIRLDLTKHHLNMFLQDTILARLADLHLSNIQVGKKHNS